MQLLGSYPGDSHDPFAQQDHWPHDQLGRGRRPSADEESDGHRAAQATPAARKTKHRVGKHRELEVLMTLLRDPVWWVRYHAAQALTRLDGLAPGELELLREGVRDAYAADMLGQAMAQMRRATRPITLYSASIPLLKKKLKFGAKSSIVMPRLK